ncbi:MAG: hypothetical protein ABI299_13100 [Rhodanobacter sp.]
MEEVIDCVNAQSSPEELAIHFLLRHAECRRALMSSGEKRAQPARVAPVLALRSKPADVPVAPTSVASPDVTPVLVGVPASEESCAARFSRAYAAARHLSAADNALRAASKKVA